MSLYGRLFAAGYDKFMAGPEKAMLHARRESLLAGVRGRVVEIGGGTGANLPFYGSGVEELVITEPEEPMARRLEHKLAALQQEHGSGNGGPLASARVVHAPAEQLPFEDQSFDFAVSTLVLCTVEDPGRALGEIHRVLAPGGQLVFIEHVRADDEGLAGWQDRLDWFQRRVGHGCHANRRTQENMESAGFTIAQLEHDRLRKAPPIVRPLIVGAAQRNSA